MSRLLLAITLSLFANVALADGPAAADAAGESTTKPGKATAVAATQDNEAAAPAPAAPPARSSTPARAPRWHSLLPGMIR